MAKKTNYKDLLNTSNADIDKLHQIVVKALKEEKLISHKLLKKTETAPKLLAKS